MDHEYLLLSWLFYWYQDIQCHQSIAKPATLFQRLNDSLSNPLNFIAFSRVDTAEYEVIEYVHFTSPLYVKPILIVPYVEII